MFMLLMFFIWIGFLLIDRVLDKVDLRMDLVGVFLFWFRLRFKYKYIGWKKLKINNIYIYLKFIIIIF